MKDYITDQTLQEDTYEQEEEYLEHLHHNPSCTSGLQPGWEMSYPDALGIFIAYASGFATKEQLKNSFIKFDFRTNKQEVVDSKFFRKDIMVLAEIYRDIDMKQLLRKEKAEKQKKHPIAYV